MSTIISAINPIGVIVLSSFFYHFFQKTIASDINPLVSLIVTYASALVLSLTILVMYPGEFKFSNNSFSTNITWSSCLLGISTVGLEGGYLLSYRYGSSISSTSIISNIITTIFLFLLGIIIYKESLSFDKVIGFILCTLGLYFIK